MHHKQAEKYFVLSMDQGYDMAELFRIRVVDDFLKNLVHILERLKEGCNHDEQQSVLIRVVDDFLKILIPKNLIEQLKKGCNHDEQQTLFCNNDFHLIKRSWFFQ